jgi:RNA polymerase sigma-70 factor (sigma-E family)
LEAGEPEETVVAASADVGVDMGSDYGTFYARERHAALQLATLLLQDRTAAEDVVHDAFARVLARWDRIETPVAYLRTVVVNEVRSRHRRKMRESAGFVKLGPCGSSALHADEITDALAQLPDRQRAVLVLCYYADLREREIAEALGCRVGTVKSLKSRALARLRGEIQR